MTYEREACAAEDRTMAEKADGHAIDVERLSDAWSEKNHCAFLLSGSTSHSMSCYFLS